MWMAKQWASLLICEPTVPTWPPKPLPLPATRFLKIFGEPYLPSAPRKYTTKAKNAQEAHEAIRPTELSRHPDKVRKALDADQLALYDLIWKRTIASQMESAEMERTTADIEAQGIDGKTYQLPRQRFGGQI